MFYVDLVFLHSSGETELYKVLQYQSEGPRWESKKMYPLMKFRCLRLYHPACYTTSLIRRDISLPHLADV
jgi:hypothetical protein